MLSDIVIDIIRVRFEFGNLIVRYVKSELLL